jgi:hypothetical protein
MPPQLHYFDAATKIISAGRQIAAALRFQPTAGRDNEHREHADRADAEGGATSDPDRMAGRYLSRHDDALV